MTTGEPLVGPGENEGPRDARLEGGVHLPGQDLPLPLLTLAKRIDPEFCQDQRLVEGNIVQPCDVATKSGLVVEINIETNEISEVDRQIFGGWIIRVADERLRMLGLGTANERSEKPAHRF